MKGFLVDTNCISELTKQAPEKKVLNWFSSVNESALYLSVLTIGELRKGIELVPGNKRKQVLLDWLQHDLQIRFAGRLLPIDQNTAEKWGILAAEGKLHGRPLGTTDGLIAATALANDLVLVTRNVKDFTNHLKAMHNPWD